MDFGEPVAGYGHTIFDKVEERHGPETADRVRLASLPIDERLRVLRHRQAAIKTRAGELVREHLRPEDN
jgi:hypothetical protein